MNETIEITFTVQHVPVAQPRVKATTRGGHAAVYTPETVKTSLGRKPHPVVEFKYAVREAARKAMGGHPPFVGPVSLSWVALFPRPKTMTWKTKPMPRCPHIARPDRDNVDKALMDSLKGIVLTDDCQVCAGSLAKLYCAGDEQPCVQVLVKAIGEKP
jgi:Holliday junction resolvase RusA-like endonuclease